MKYAPEERFGEVIVPGFRHVPPIMLRSYAVVFWNRATARPMMTSV
jgi:hypothetical protein